MAETEMEKRLHQAIKDAWPYVNRPWVSDSAKDEVERFVIATSVSGRRSQMLFALQTAWTFVHGSDNDALKTELRDLLNHGEWWGTRGPTAPVYLDYQIIGETWHLFAADRLEANAPLGAEGFAQTPQPDSLEARQALEVSIKHIVEEANKGGGSPTLQIALEKASVAALTIGVPELADKLREKALGMKEPQYLCSGPAAEAAAYAAGYRIEQSTADQSPDFDGKWWWTLCRDGWGGVECSPDQFETEDAAKADMVRAHAEELASASHESLASPGMGM